MGKGGGALSAWMKEFVTLVFVQTIQAFIFAIIISIILYGLGSNDASGISADDNNAALGLMSVFALLSLFKVEDMVRKIFGISDTKASHRSALGSLAKTAVAAKLGARVLNNTGKFLGGVRGITQAGQDRRKAKKRLEEDMKDEGFIKDKDGKIRRAPKGVSGTGVSSDSKTSSSGTSSSGTGAGDTAGDVGGGSAGVSAGDTKAMTDAAYRRVKNSLRAYEDKMSEINKARDEGVKNILSSMAESAGAVVGGTAGGILGGADGDIEGMLQGIMAGAGAGDTAGKGVVELSDRAVKFVNRNVKREKGVSNRELKRAIDQYKDALDKVKRNGEFDVDDID